MIGKQITLGLVLGLAIVNVIFASDPAFDNKDFDINSITYIEDELEVEIDLGFDPTDYLPEGFDPYKMYVDLNGIKYIEEEVELSFNSRKHLPKGFDPYAYPNHVSGFNYIDEADSIQMGFDVKKYLPKGFDPYMEKAE